MMSGWLLILEESDQHQSNGWASFVWCPNHQYVDEWCSPSANVWTGWCPRHGSCWTSVPQPWPNAGSQTALRICSTAYWFVYHPSVLLLVFYPTSVVAKARSTVSDAPVTVCLLPHVGGSQSTGYSVLMPLWLCVCYPTSVIAKASGTVFWCLCDLRC